MEKYFVNQDTKQLALIGIGHYEPIPALDENGNHEKDENGELLYQLEVDDEGNQKFKMRYVEHPVPENCFEVPTAPEHAQQIWDGEKWLPLDPAIIKAEQDVLIAQAMALEADPLFFKWQAAMADGSAGKVEKAKWLAKRDEIKKRYE